MASTSLILILVCVVTAFTSAANVKRSTPYFRKDYIYSADQNAFYKYHEFGQTWSSAFATCQGESSDFFVPKSRSEIDQVLKFYSANEIWIAAHDMFSDKEFITLDGKPISNLYVQWASYEPNNQNNNENCLIMNRYGEYADVNCERNIPFICKKTAVNITQNSKCDTHDTEYVFKQETGNCYKFHTRPLTWHQAFKTCYDEESNLVIINSMIEANILSGLFAKYPRDSIKGSTNKDCIHVGFSELYSNGLFMTIEGKTLTDAGYDVWAKGQPDKFQNNEHCGCMYREGDLNDNNCESRALFVCEKILNKR